MPARKKTARRVGRPPKVGQGLWKEPEKNVPKEGTVVPVNGTVERLDPAGDLDEEQREMFAKLLRENFSLEERAKQLVELARLTDTKRAAVGLRAIQEINAITGVHDPKPQETAAMFNLPEGTSVNLHVEKVVK